MHPARRADREKWWWLALGLAFLVLLYFLSPTLTAFLLGAILAYILNPLVGWLERHGVNRTVGAVIAIALIAGLLVLFVLIVVPLFTKEIRLLIERLPAVLDQVNTRLVPRLRERFGIELQLDPASVRDYFAEAVKGTEGLGMTVLQSLRIGSATLIGFAVTVLLVPVVLFYLMRDWDR